MNRNPTTSTDDFTSNNSTESFFDSGSTVIDDDGGSGGSPTPNESPNLWEDIPIEIYSEILSYLPVLPNYFRLSRVCKAWKEIFHFLMNDYFEFSSFHLDFSEVDPYQMEYSDLLKIICKCRGVKKITLHYMKVTPEILKAIGRTSVETLIISNCEVRKELEDDDYGKTKQFHYHKSIALEFYEIKENLEITNLYLKQLQKFSNNFKLSKQTKYFQHLKTVAFLDTPFYYLIDRGFSLGSGTSSIKYVEIPTYDRLDIDNIVSKPIRDESPSTTTSTFTFFSPISYNNAQRMVTLVNHDSSRTINILCITHGFIEAQTVINHQSIDYIRINPAKDYEKCYQFFMKNKLPFNLKSRVSFVSSCKNLEVYKKFVEAGYIKLMDLDINERTVLYEALDRAYETSPDFTSTPNNYTFSNWRHTTEITSLINTIKWIHENSELKAQIDMKGPIFKEYLSVCKNMDKRWNNYFSKYKELISDKIDWQHFIQTGEEKAPSKKRKQASTSTSSSVQPPSKKR